MSNVKPIFVEEHEVRAIVSELRVEVVSAIGENTAAIAEIDKNIAEINKNLEVWIKIYQTTNNIQRFLKWLGQFAVGASIIGLIADRFFR